MAASPVKPDDFKAVIPAANSNLCTKLLLVLIKLPALIYQWFAWAMNADGTPTDDFKAWLGVTAGALVPPTGLLASDGTYTDKVVLTWNPVSGATYYEVFRADKNDNTAATSIASLGQGVITYTDESVADDTVYWYFVKAHNATDSSGFSDGNSGFCDTSGGGGVGSTGTLTFDSNGNWTVPVGVTDIQVELWGGSGGGGGSACPYCIAGTAFYSGGGGGSGEYLKVKSVPVTAGETLNMVVGSAGAGGGIGGGYSGSPSILRRGASDLITAFGGAGGLGGDTGTNPGTGGAGGTSGSASVGSIDTQTNGNAGVSGTKAYPVPAGGAGGAAVGGGPGAGGNGGSNGNGTAGAKGRVKIVWPSP